MFFKDPDPDFVLQYGSGCGSWYINKALNKIGGGKLLVNKKRRYRWAVGILFYREFVYGIIFKNKAKIMKNFH